ncbi:proline racemase family protein [Halococcus sp. PRR34]|uniref:proline racemase family protein n=1 Tax=Halococcus sp. PRR34 TaxID=3020830 RepID=UPI00236294E9|nr:proline racemase family protein [Halococcus sp. PRR34]
MTTDGVEWHPPTDRTTIETIDTHTGGEPLRVVLDGLPPLVGDTVLEKRRYVERELDAYRKALIWEPRGHADMYGAIPTAPDTERADLGVLFMHNEGYSTMCGHGIVALATIAAETEYLPDVENEIAIDTPAGLVVAEIERDGDRVDAVEFTNVPSFVVARNETVSVPEWGTIEFDVAFGGAFYAYCDAGQFDVDLTPAEFRDLIEIGTTVTRAVDDAVEIEHPHEDDLGFLYGTILTGDAHTDADSRNVCVFADGEVDRCPTGTGVSGRVALRAAAGELDRRERFVVESIVGSTFAGSYMETTDFGEYDAVRPQIEGSAHITGRHQFVVDPADPFDEGFVLR